MLPINIQIAGYAIALIVGFGCGYSIRADKADIERLQATQQALEIEKQHLIKQIEVEHEQQKAEKAITAQTKENLADLENRYADAVAELNELQLQFAEQDDNEPTALSPDATSAKSISQGQCKCPGTDQRKLQRLYESQLVIAKDCDINSTYLNNIIDWYHSISK